MIDETAIYLPAEVFIEDFLPFVHHWNYEEAERTLWRWAREGKLNGELTREQYDQIAIWQRKPDTRRREFTRYIPKKLRRYVMERDGGKCQTCQSPEHPTLDHIRPYVNGGRHIASNLRVLCRSCNSRKGARIVRA